MNSKIIELRHKWELGQQFAEGGFGRIYETKDENGLPAVIKLIPKIPSAARELLFEPISGLPNIVPVIDSGEWNGCYVLVMPRAEKSLRQYLHELGGKLPLGEAVQILLDVTEALAGLQKDVVHRDLKPENILLYQNRWCLADFGIARYAEATTAPDTHKHSFTPPYAAPEQWRGERATPATDIYAFGITAFELLQGHRPFLGQPSYREQHLNQKPSSLTSCPLAISALVTECLYKAPEARPIPANILTRLRASQQPSSPAFAQLQAANQVIVNKQAQVEAAASAKKSIEEQRKALFTVAQQSFEIILEKLVDQVRNAAPAASVTRSPYLIIQLGEGRLSVNSIQSAPPNCLAASNASPVLDIIAYTSITVQKPRDQYKYEGRSHSLWFCDAHDEHVYRWFETAFMVGAFFPYTSVVNPFALSPTDEMAIRTGTIGTASSMGAGSI